MRYKGYSAKVEYDEEAGVLHGSIEGIRDVVTFEATSVRELEEAFRESVTDYLKMCEERGEEPDRPYSGRFVMRIPPEIHRALALEASRASTSLNALALQALEYWLAQRGSEYPMSPMTPASRPTANASSRQLHRPNLVNLPHPEVEVSAPAGRTPGAFGTRDWSTLTPTAIQ